LPLNKDTFERRSENSPPGQAQEQKPRPNRSRDMGRMIQKESHSFFPGHWTTGQDPHSV